MVQFFLFMEQEGKQIVKKDLITTYCFVRKPIDGEWSEWAGWLSLNETHVIRSRQCDNPPYLFDGQECSGPSQEVLPIVMHGTLGGKS